MLVRERQRLMTKSRIEGAPSLLIEVLSPSNRSHDTMRKKARYAASGVPEYWIVDPERHTVEQWLLRDAQYPLAVTATESVALVALPQVTIALRRVW